MTNIVFGRVSLLVAAQCAALGASANLIVNGGFEDRPTDTFLYRTGITGWEIPTGIGETGAGEFYGVQGYEGTQVLELDSVANSTVQQILTGLEAGKEYDLSFLYGRRFATSAETNAFSVLWNGNVIGSYAPTSTTLTLTGARVTAVTGNNAISFVGTGASDTFGGIIDDVKLEAVPEPASCAALALGAVAMLRRRKNS